MGFDLASLTNVVMFTFSAIEYEVKKKNKAQSINYM